MTTPKHSSSIQSVLEPRFPHLGRLITSEPAVLSRYGGQEKSVEVRMTLLYSRQRQASSSSALLKDVLQRSH
ncbi:hypothetical protein QQF64_009189 [Cirrhinus molitorella]|uniref:Uncharacterized protein n=1 Tax=Cirrhinus molitorella TaxID=172907 RepID=A0ABR3M410_9TELE